ncbi:hypothetical protein [Luteococcus peritonei]|uniref:PQQ-binding-like beta-propeller repeat protein n=1 Tax=Luteococcus peritonei TaxID=88874 RepID=A0ABW4RUK7_9ACTN
MPQQDQAVRSQAFPTPAPTDPARPAGATLAAPAPTGEGWAPGGAHPARPAARRLPRLLLVLGLVGAVLAGSLAWWVRPRHPDLTAPTGPGIPRITPRPSGDPVALPTDWRTSAEVLREGQGFNPMLAHPLDGLGASPSGVLDGGSALVAITLAQPQDEDSARVHGIDPTTGRARWTRPMPGALCAAQLFGGDIACLAVADREPATGLGRRWTLRLLDPTTGRVERSAELAAHLVGLRVVDDCLVLLEQEPAGDQLPTVRLRGLDAALATRWTTEVNAIAGGADPGLLFSTDRLLLRGPELAPGPALFNPSLEPIGQGLVALSAGAGTALVRAADGRPAALLGCTTATDDGARIWCNDDGGAVAHARDGSRRLVRAEAGTRVLPVRTDPRLHAPVTAVFARADRTLVRLDPATGSVVGPLAEALGGDALGQGSAVRVVQAGDLTIVSDERSTVAFDQQLRQVWRSGQVEELGQAWWQQRPGRGQRLWLLGGDAVHLVDPQQGWLRGSYRVPDAQHLQVVGQGRGELLLGWGGTALSRVRMP